MIDIQRLAVLREVARAGSFAGAAGALHHTPSAVSQQIAALERSTGLPLVNRSTRGVTLTDAGRLLLSTADTVHAEVRAAERQLQYFHTDGPRTLTVATFSSAGASLLAPALTALVDERPDTAITVLEAEPDDALAHLRSGDVDLALVYHYGARKPPIHWTAQAGAGDYVSLVEDPLRLVVPDAYSLVHEPTVDIADLTSNRWISGWGDTGDVLDSLAGVAGFRPDIACRASDYRFMTALVAAGVGVALIPQLALQPQRGVQALTLSPEPVRHVGAYQPRRRWRHRAADTLLIVLQQQARTWTTQLRWEPSSVSTDAPGNPPER